MIYDYIIVGAGSAGCIMASRLSENGQNSVLLLEAGPDNNDIRIQTPSLFGSLFKSAMDWNYTTEPTKNNRAQYWPRGKVVGGTSSINAMIYIRGNTDNFDEWYRLGNKGWSFSDCLPFFKKIEARAGATIAPLKTINPLTHIFLDACKANGMEASPNFNGPTQDGYGLYRVQQKQGRRFGVADLYLTPARNRENLHLEVNAEVTKILFQKNRAIGVSYTKDSKSIGVFARREVIVSGGAVNSPKILMLSGIGPKNHLEKHGITVIKDLPGVGRNLQDHPFIAIQYECAKPITLEKKHSIWDKLRYRLFGTGPISSNIAEAGAFIRTSPQESKPNIQIIFGPTYFKEHGFQNPKGYGYCFIIELLYPKSSGYIELRSKNPQDAPLIYPNYFDEKDDIKTLIQGIKIVRKIGESTVFTPFCKKEMYPGVAVQSDEELKHFILTDAQSLYHPVGTCKMGVDKDAVVDPELRVHGIEGLRVVDASVMPKITGGNVNAPIMMIAEKAAALILD